MAAAAKAAAPQDTPGCRRLGVLARQVLYPAATAAQEAADYAPGEYFGVLPSYEHPIVYPKTGILSEAAAPTVTLPSLLAEAAKNFPQHVALAVEKNPPPPEAPGVAPSLPWEAWKKWTWQQYYEDARRLAKAFMVLGVERFGSVSIFGFNSPEWAISAWGAMLCGGKYVGIYGTDTPDQVQYKVAHSASAVISVDGQLEFDSVASKIDEMPGLKAVVAWGIAPAPGGLKRSDGSVCQVLSFEDCLKLGDERGSDSELEARLAAIKPGHCIGIIYTSGTTGNPKAVMVHSDSIVVQGTMTSLPEMGMIDAFQGPEGARVLSYLPLSHIAGGLMDLLNPVFYAGKLKLKGTVYFARPNDLKEMTLANRIVFVQPTVFLAVPRVFEKIQAKMMAVAATITGVKKSLATWAKGKGLEYARNVQVGGSRQKPFLHGLADKLVLSKARTTLGLDKCKVFLTGAAPISKETLEYFGQLGMMIQNCYGMSESSGVTTMTSPMRNLFGSVGATMPGVEVKCFKEGPGGENVEVPLCEPGKNAPESHQGELCYRGRHIMMGYMANPDFGPEHVKEIEDKNRSAIDKFGWLHSGDKGCIDTNGMVRITGRYKELIIGAGGENIAPVPVEESIKQLCPALSNVMMVGDNRKYNVALVTLLAEGSTGEFPGGDNLTGVALDVSPGVTTISQAMKDPVWQKYIQSGIDRTNNNPNVCLNNAWKIQKFAIAPRDFSVQTGEFTATLKLRRSVADDMWKDLIDSMF